MEEEREQPCLNGSGEVQGQAPLCLTPLLKKSGSLDTPPHDSGLGARLGSIKRDVAELRKRRRKRILQPAAIRREHNKGDTEEREIADIDSEGDAEEMEEDRK
jgi:hypothetical protein